MPESLVRSFICVNVPPDWEKALAGMSEGFKNIRSRVSWVKSFHLTLKFLGEISHLTLERVSKLLGEVTPRFSPFSLSLDKTGCFPGLRSPRIIWVGVKEDGDTLMSLYDCLEEGLGDIGFKREKKRFTSHLTLGRVRRLDASDNLGERVRNLSCPRVPAFQIKSLELMRSVLGPPGASYSVIGSYNLGS